MFIFPARSLYFDFVQLLSNLVLYFSAGPEVRSTEVSVVS